MSEQGFWPERTTFNKPEESAALKGVATDQTTPESHCEKVDGVTPCTCADTADAWAQYLSCLVEPLTLPPDFPREILESMDELPWVRIGESCANSPCPSARLRLGPLIIQRAAVSSAPVPDVPPIVHDVVHSPGHPLDDDTRVAMEQSATYTINQTDPSSCTGLWIQSWHAAMTAVL